MTTIDGRWQIEAIYRSLPTINCKGLCSNQCQGIWMSETERHQIRKRKGFILRDLNKGQTCPLLDRITHRCTAYDIRPLICRLWGVTERMKCPHGCQPDRYLTDREELSITLQVLRLGGSWPDEIADGVAELFDDPELFAVGRKVLYEEVSWGQAMREVDAIKAARRNKA